ncbi:hypothetical protein [Dyella lutea]|uniref:Phytanoyl-CoA dioxygenase family protein n=1 Tax=Dyella lutea TaxID=2950441 RepID=A0ABT1F9N2_9GAMM|nr:hypothetical protein [Dyella lutea]MCP1374082.1 hypothetical protein [Dyella lutea]
MKKTTQAIAQELETRGFSVVRGFLAAEDVTEDLLTFLAEAPKFADGVINGIADEQMSGIRRKIETLIPEIGGMLGLSMCQDRFNYCAIRIREAHGEPVLRTPFNPHRDPKVAPGGVLNWHLDHFSYYLYGDHRNWLICYMPVIKPSPDLANLAIIPSDVLESCDTELSRRIQGRGAMRFRRVETDTMAWFRMRFPEQTIAVDDWFAIDDFDDSTMGWKINIDLEKCKVVPRLDVHDLLIMRADVIHRTNDAGSDRISIRCDGMPSHAREIDTTMGLLKLTASLPFVGKKRRYNLRNWVKTEWKKRLRRSFG